MEILDLLPMLGLNAGKVLSIIGLADMAKDYLRKQNFDGIFKRTYPFLPFPAAFVVCWSDPERDMGLLMCGAVYGMIAVFAHNIIKKTVQGK